MPLATWTAHPAKRRPQHVALYAMVLCLFCGAVLASLHSPLLAGLAAIVLTVSIAPFLFPTRYELTREGVIEHRLGRKRARRWRELRRLEIGPGAALLSPFSRPSVLDRYRGIVVLLDGCDRRRVLDILKEHVGASE